MGDVVHNVSSGVGGAVHDVTSGVRRLLTAPPESEDDLDDDEHPGVLPATPRNASSPYSEYPQSDL